MMGLMPLESPQRAFFFSLPCEDKQEVMSTSGKRALTQNPAVLASDLGLSASRIVRNKFLLLVTQFMVFVIAALSYHYVPCIT